MNEALANGIVTVAGVYLLLGVVFAVPFVLKGVNRLEPSAAQGTRGFRLLILPGAIALWPLLLRRWLAASGQQPEERSAHRAAAKRKVES